MQCADDAPAGALVDVTSIRGLSELPMHKRHSYTISAIHI